MSQYTTGLVNVTSSSQIITGASTLWSANIAVGNLFKVSGESVIYTVASVSSNTQISLSANYAGATQTGVKYQIVRDFTPIYSIPLIMAGDIDWPVHLSNALVKLESNIAGHPGLLIFANNAAAIAGGLTVGAFYRTGTNPDQVMVVH